MMWQKYKFDESKIYTGQVGNIRFWIEKLDKIWQVATQHVPDVEMIPAPLKPVSSFDEGISWSYHVADKHNNLLMVPCCPDRSLVVKPAKKFSILPGMSLDIFIEVPLWIQLYASSNKPGNLLLEFPATELSSTWFGAPDNGELAYSCPGEISFYLKQINAHPGIAICPLKIKNESDTILDFQRLSVPVEQLNLYSNTKDLCTNEVQFRYKGEDKSNEIHISAGSPSLFEDLKLVNNARIIADKNIFKKSFSFIKSMADY